MQIIFTQSCNKRTSRAGFFNEIILSWHILSRYTWNLKAFEMVIKSLRVETCMCSLQTLPESTWEQYPSFLSWWKTFMQPKGPSEYHISILYLGSEIKDLISCTVGFHGTVCRFAARSQELSSFLSEWQDEALRERWLGHFFRCWHLLASFRQEHTSVCRNSLCLVPNGRNLRGVCVCSSLVLM